MLSEARLKRIVKESEPYLNMLEELDRTGKLRKASYKERVNFTIDSEVMLAFRRYCEKQSVSMSNKVENLIKDFLKSK
jgi:hypothetical protein